MKDIDTPGQALESGGFATFAAPRSGVFHLALLALARQGNHHDASFPTFLLPRGPASPLCQEGRSAES